MVTARKWWTTGAMRPHCRLLIVMGVSDPDGGRHGRHSLLLVPTDTPDVQIQRSTLLFGGTGGGHAEIVYDHVRVPGATCWAACIAVSRLRRPGSVPAASTIACGLSGWPRAGLRSSSSASGPAGRLGDGHPRPSGGCGRHLHDQARGAADGPAASSIGLFRFTAGAGFSDDFPLARLYAQARMLRIGDGPDEVHRMVVAKRERKRQIAAGVAGAVSKEA